MLKLAGGRAHSRSPTAAPTCGPPRATPSAIAPTAAAYTGPCRRRPPPNTTSRMSPARATTSNAPRLPALGRPWLFQRQMLANVRRLLRAELRLGQLQASTGRPQNQAFSLSGDHVYKTNQDYQQVTTSTPVARSPPAARRGRCNGRPTTALATSSSSPTARAATTPPLPAAPAARPRATDQVFRPAGPPPAKIDFNFDKTTTTSVGSVQQAGSPNLSRQRYSLCLYNPAALVGLWASTMGGGDRRWTTEHQREQVHRRQLPPHRAPLALQEAQPGLLHSPKRLYPSGAASGYLADSNQLTKNVSATYQFSDAVSFNAQWAATPWPSSRRAAVRSPNNTL